MIIIILGKIIKFLFHRVFFVGIMILIQISALIVVILKFDKYFVFFYGASVILSIAAALYVLNNNQNPAYKIAWIVPILLMPIFGGLFFVMFGRPYMSKRDIIALGETAKKMIKSHTDKSVIHELFEVDRYAALQSSYIAESSFCPPYKNTYTKYLPMGEIKFENMIRELEKAEKYIFMEYFIIEEGKMWNSILEILERKAAQGLDVRVMYDDLGCIMTLPYKYYERLRKKGIRCCVFNTFKPILTTTHNCRDHRKICVIDGLCGFTGGVNLADEYINEKEKCGHWKDSAILIKGEAVWSLTTLFLSMWGSISGEKEDFEDFKPNYKDIEGAEGYIQPYADSPIDEENVAETVYMNIINRAEKYIYITTPYLIIDNEMLTALSTAAKSGVDVRIITPHIPDKKFVHIMTRAYYDPLIRNGVKIYEYIPGFIHAKTFVSDDKTATVGTINLDYRSLYLHFECGCWIYNTSTVFDIKNDFIKTLEKCQNININHCNNVKWHIRFIRSILRCFAPLM